MAEYQVLYWKDIPAQVRVFDGKRRVARQMPSRFQDAIDRRAMKEGLAGTDAYLAHWQWSERQERPATRRRFWRRSCATWRGLTTNGIAEHRGANRN